MTQTTCTSAGFIEVLNVPTDGFVRISGPTVPKPAGSNANLFAYLSPGTYNLTLTVGTCTSPVVAVVIDPAPAPPVLLAANVHVVQPTTSTGTGFIEVLNVPTGGVVRITGPTVPKPAGGNANLFVYLKPGNYSLTLTVNGCTSAPFLVELTAPGGQRVVSYTLVNADTDGDIQPLMSGSMLNLATLPTRHLNIRANTDPATVGSVVFDLDGAALQNRTESFFPYALFSDYLGDYFSWTPPLGRYSLTAWPHTASGGGGATGTPLTIIFTVIDVPVRQRVVSYTLVNADTDGDIQPLVSGSTLNLATLPTRHLNIRANTDPATVGSVVFDLDGAALQNRTESFFPYALFSDYLGDYFSWTPPLGRYSLTAWPHTASGGAGTTGTPLTITFTVVDQPAAFISASSSRTPSSDEQLIKTAEAYPNPTPNGKLTVSLPPEYVGEVSYVLVSSSGTRLAEGKRTGSLSGGILTFDFSREVQSSGFYYLLLNGVGLKARVKLLRQ